MRCPICNAKMPMQTACRYCKITGEQVIYASNVEAKKALRKGEKDKVYLSSHRPYDVSKSKLILYSALFGFLGVNSFYVGRYNRGFFCLFSVVLAFLFSTLKILSTNFGWNSIFFDYSVQITAILCCVVIIMWFTDIVSSIFGNFKIPVVLPSLEWLTEREKRNEK